MPSRQPAVPGYFSSMMMTDSPQTRILGRLTVFFFKHFYMCMYACIGMCMCKHACIWAGAHACVWMRERDSGESSQYRGVTIVVWFKASTTVPWATFRKRRTWGEITKRANSMPPTSDVYEVKRLKRWESPMTTSTWKWDNTRQMKSTLRWGQLLTEELTEETGFLPCVSCTVT